MHYPSFKYNHMIIITGILPHELSEHFCQFWPRPLCSELDRIQIVFSFVPFGSNMQHVLTRKYSLGLRYLYVTGSKCTGMGNVYWTNQTIMETTWVKINKIVPIVRVVIYRLLWSYDYIDRKIGLNSRWKTEISEIDLYRDMVKYMAHAFVSWLQLIKVVIKSWFAIDMYKTTDALVIQLNNTACFLECEAYDRLVIFLTRPIDNKKRNFVSCIHVMPDHRPNGF